RTGCATPPPRTCWKAARTCGASRNCWATRRCPARRSTRTCRWNGCARRTSRRIRGPDHRTIPCVCDPTPPEPIPGTDLLFAVDHACARAGAVHTVVELSLCPTDDEVVDAVRAAAGDRTRLVIVDHVTSPTARLFPVARVVSALRGTGVPVLVDAAHVPGQLPVRVDAIGADFWVGNLYKWAFAPRGTALLAVAPAWREKVRPLVVSWEHAAGYPHSVEHQGTLDYTPWLASTAGLRTLRSLGLSAVHAHNTALVAYGQHAVGRAVGLDPDTLPSRPA